MKEEKIKLEVEGATKEELERYKEVLCALITTGGLIGVRGGQTILHFNEEGVFMSVQLSYRPWVRRKNKF